MIVVDTNIISYLLLPTPTTDAAEALYLADPDWAAPVLWRSEFRNVLALYLRKGLLVLHEALSVQERAEDLLTGREYQVRSTDVLRLAHTSGCSAYDCEFVAVAIDLGSSLYTADKRVLRAFPKISVALRAEE